MRWNGRIYEAASALLERRAACDLYHSALRVSVPPHVYVIEVTPVCNVPRGDRGVIGEGAVGARWAGRWRLFRYEVRCWRDGTIADVAEAVASPQRITSDETICRSVLARLPDVPIPVWGRDEMHAGEMWNSNSVVAWSLSSCGLNVDTIAPPTGGRAPGWNAGIVVGVTQVASTMPAGSHPRRPG